MRMMALMLAAALFSTAAFGSGQTSAGRQAGGPGEASEAESCACETAIDRREAAGMPGDRRCDQGAAELLRRDLSADAKTQGARRQRRDGLPLHQGRRRAADLLQRLCGEDTEAAELSEAFIMARQRIADAGHDAVPLPLLGRGIVDQYAICIWPGEVTAIVPDLVVAEAGDNEEPVRDLLVDDIRRRIFRGEKAGGRKAFIREPTGRSDWRGDPRSETARHIQPPVCPRPR